MGSPEKSPRGGRHLLKILGFLRAYPVAVFASIAMLLGNIAIEMILPQILGNAITQLTWHVEWKAVFDPKVHVLLFVSLVVIRAGNGILLGPVRNRLVQRTLGDIRSAIFDATQRLSFGYHDRTSTGELVSRSTTDVSRLQDFLFACLFLSVDIVVSLVATVSLLFLASPWLGMLALGTMIPTIGLMARFAASLHQRWREVHDLHAAMTTVVQENIAGVRVVRAFAREGGEIGKFRDHRDRFLKTLMRTVNDWAVRVPVTQFLFGLSIPLALALGGHEVIHGRMPIGDLAKAVLYLMAIGHRVGMIGQFTSIVNNASASAERIMEILSEPASIRSGTRKLPAGGGAVRFENVSFSYVDSKPVLEDVSLDVMPGSTVAVVGATGAGKSTLVHLVPRFHDPQKGRICVEGVDVRELDLRELRGQIGMIFQETFLFSATVAANIAFGRPDASREEIEAAARVAQAHEFISGLDKGYDTVIGERGVNLSGGQKQRLALARAFLMNPRILILDDAMASVDPGTERQIQEALRELRRGRTCLIIAHRVTTVRDADRIVVLDHGRLRANGTHEELMAGSEYYRDLVERQMRKGGLD